MENSRALKTLTKSSDFNHLKEKGYRLKCSQWLLLSYMPTQKPLRIGCTISSKVGTAVLRNKLKRWTKESVRKLILHEFDYEGDINFIFLSTQQGLYKGLTFNEFYNTVEKSLGKIRRRIEKSSTPNRRNL